MTGNCVRVKKQQYFIESPVKGLEFETLGPRHNYIVSQNCSVRTLTGSDRLQAYEVYRQHPQSPPGLPGVPTAEQATEPTEATWFSRSYDSYNIVDVFVLGLLGLERQTDALRTVESLI